MKILVLTKRRYNRMDLIDDRFGRARELPLGLANLGHEVTGICLSYNARPEGCSTDNEGGSQPVTWHSLNAGFVKPLGFIRYSIFALRLAQKFKPDIIYTFSDSLYALLGVWVARRIKTRCIVDLYDLFETFDTARIPGVMRLFRSAVRNADGVTAVSEFLSEWVRKNYPPQGPIQIIVNGTFPDIFHPLDRNTCRKQLALPIDAKIIAYTGAIEKSRGIHVLFQGFKQLAMEDSRLHLALAGPRDQYTTIPDDPRIHYLGILPFHDVPVLINAADVAVICNLDNLLGRAAFPQKTYEIIACRVPLVAGAIGSLKNLLRDYPECLFEPNNTDSFIEAVRHQLDKPTVPDIAVRTWADLAKNLESFLLKTIERGREH